MGVKCIYELSIAQLIAEIKNYQIESEGTVAQLIQRLVAFGKRQSTNFQ